MGRGMIDTLNKAVQDLREAIRRKESKDEAEIIKAFAIQQRNAAIAQFINECDELAEQNMLKSGKLEGSHYAAMRFVAKKMGITLPKVKFKLSTMQREGR